MPTVWIALGMLILLGIVFVFLPNGWNLIPLLLMGLVIWILAARLKTLCAAPAREPETLPDGDAISQDAGETGPKPGHASPPLARRLNRTFGPIAAGMIIDLVDLVLFGPIKLFLGFPIGGLTGYWMGRALGLNKKASLFCALAAGIYCMIPGTEFIPLATIIGACVRFQESGKYEEADQAGEDNPTHPATAHRKPRTPRTVKANDIPSKE